MAKKTKLSSVTAKPIAVKIVNDPVNKAHDRDDYERKYKIQDALRTCQEYEKIKSDKGLMKEVKNLAKEEMRKLENVAKKY